MSGHLIDIHLLLRITNRRLYRAFIKAVSGKIASHVMGQQSFKLFCESRRPSISKSSHPSSFDPNAKISRAGDGVQISKGVQNSEKINTKNGKMSQAFWEFRPFSRIVNWCRDFKNCVQYLKQNVLEALGFIPYRA